MDDGGNDGSWHRHGRRLYSRACCIGDTASPLPRLRYRRELSVAAERPRVRVLPQVTKQPRAGRNTQWFCRGKETQWVSRRPLAHKETRGTCLAMH